MKTNIILLLACLLFYSCETPKTIGCTDPTSFNYNPNAQQSDNSCNSMGNCSGYIIGASNSGIITTSLDDPYWDQKMGEEVALQRNFYGGIPANVYILREPALMYKNAYARTDGNILFGYFMFYYTIQTYGELPVAGILAHEWGHRVQQHLNLQGYYKPEHRELEADAFSGYYMALRKQWSWAQIQSYFANVYATGNYLFNDPDFHGTPEQRLAAAYLGVNMGLNALTNGIQYNYNDLHSIFFNEISSNIAPRGTSTPLERQFKEIKYPAGLTEKYIKSLFPTIK